MCFYKIKKAINCGWLVQCKGNKSYKGLQMQLIQQVRKKIKLQLMEYITWEEQNIKIVTSEYGVTYPFTAQLLAGDTMS